MHISLEKCIPGDALTMTIQRSTQTEQHFFSRLKYIKRYSPFIVLVAHLALITVLFIAKYQDG